VSSINKTPHLNKTIPSVTNVCDRRHNALKAVIDAQSLLRLESALRNGPGMKLRKASVQVSISSVAHVKNHQAWARGGQGAHTSLKKPAVAAGGEVA
jgi:hypothetical protein